MKKIIKNAEPQLLVQHRANQPAFYIGLPAETKDALRQSLLSEQGNICCYCMRRIPEKVVDDEVISYKMKIEHYQCQDKYPLAQLNYSNLYGVCTGNEGKPKKMQTCDTKKANDDISVDSGVCSPLIPFYVDPPFRDDDPTVNLFGYGLF